MEKEMLVRLVSDGFVEAKGGKAKETYLKIIPAFESGELPLKSHYAFGWIIYYALHQSGDKEISERKHLLANYLKLKVTVPHKLHSMILTEAMRLYKDARDAAFNNKDSIRFSIVGFSGLWGLSNLRPGDWRRKEHEGKPMASTVEKFITLYVDELEEKKMQPSDTFLKVAAEALTTYPDSFNLLSQIAAVRMLQGKTDEARRLLRKAILLAPGKFFLWSRLAATVSPLKEMRLHVALLHRALRSPGQEQFKGRIRLSLAEAMIIKEAWPQALWELNKVRQTYEANGWHLPLSYHACMKKIPFHTVAQDPEPLYGKVAHMADNEIYDSLPPVPAVKTYHKNPSPDDRQPGRFSRPQAAWRVTTPEGRNYWLRPARFGIPAELPLGTRLSIRLHNERPVKADLDSVPTP